MHIERHGAVRRHGFVTLVRAPAQVYGANGPDWATFRIRGQRGVPDAGTTHMYTVLLSKEEILAAVSVMLAESGSHKIAKPVCSLLREMLARKKRGR
jgi:hypothetical protein